MNKEKLAEYVKQKGLEIVNSNKTPDKLYKGAVSVFGPEEIMTGYFSDNLHVYIDHIDDTIAFMVDFENKTWVYDFKNGKIGKFQFRSDNDNYEDYLEDKRGKPRTAETWWKAPYYDAPYSGHDQSI